MTDVPRTKFEDGKDGLIDLNLMRIYEKEHCNVAFPRDRSLQRTGAGNGFDDR